MGDRYLVTGVKPVIIVGSYTVNQLKQGKEVHLENAILIPDDEYFKKVRTEEREHDATS